MRTSHLTLLSAATLGFLFTAVAVSAAPAFVNVNGKIYYIVNGNDSTMDTGAEVCASVGKVCKAYGTIATNAVCVKFHPTARSLSLVDGSKAEFFCDGPPQTGVCGNLNMKNVCAVCPKCNLNEASTCNQPIGGHFREMYIECVTPIVRKSSSSKKKYSSSRRSSSKHASKRSSLRSKQSSSQRVIYTPPTRGKQYGPLPMPRGRGASSAQSQQITCTFTQQPLKKVTCGAYKAADTFCALVMQSIAAKSLQCSDTGNVVCAIPCSAPGVQNLKQCAQGGMKVGSCPAPQAPTPTATKKRAGEACKHGGECNTTFCVGQQDYYKGMIYLCSCSQWKYDTTCGK